MRYSKYCHSDVVDRVAAGLFRFGSLAWYRQIEERTGDDVIGDRNEGREVAHLDQQSYSSDRTADQDAALRSRGIHINGPGTVVVSNATFIQDCGHLLVLCLSLSNELELAGSDYDACVEIADIDAFVRCLWETGTVDGQNIRDVFSAIEHQRVEYVPREIELSRDLQSYGASPFRKAEQYEPQQEYRIVLRPHDEWMPDIRYIEIQPPAGLLKVVANDGTYRARAVSTGPTKQAILANLQSLVAELEAVENRNQELSGWQQPIPQHQNFEVYAQLLHHLHQSRQQEFKAAFGQKITEAYWGARELGHRGIWERFLGGPPYPARWMIIEELKRLANDLEPNTYQLRSKREVRPRACR